MHQLVRSEVAAQKLCRFRDGASYPPAQFDLVTCTWCYAYSGHDWFLPGRRLLLGRRRWQVNGSASVIYYLHTANGSTALLANLSDPAAVDAIARTFAEPHFAAKWAECCRSSQQCCRNVLQRAAAGAADRGQHCPATEDAWLCWNETRPGTTVYQPCPDYIYTHRRPSCRVFAKKECTANGTWAGSAPHGEYTDYGDCTNTWHGLVRQYINIACNVVSMLVLLPAVVLTAIIRSLHSGQFLLHGSLMAALLVRCVMVVWRAVVLNLSHLTGAVDGTDGGIGCRLLQALYKYAVLSSWTWMLTVGLGLHHSVARPFAKPFKTYVFCTLGWGVPALFVGGWAAAKALLEDELCWMLNVHHLVWILDAPKLACLLLNLVFMVNVLRILNTKLQSSEGRRRSFRALAMLVPLFGLQFLVTALPPKEDVDCAAEQAYYIASYLISGLQGAVVACIYFYTNAEVRTQLRRQYRVLQARSGLGGRAPSRRRTLSTEAPSSVALPRRHQVTDAGEPTEAQHLTVTSLLGSEPTEAQQLTFTSLLGSEPTEAQHLTFTSLPDGGGGGGERPSTGPPADTAA
ncbi:secretin receptor-like [Pollicipes pollicipes]|uniref:secretin receptor-like n=1 Tax=Pollicipes pollicipes TaxID=41117 RepID=UPI0018854D42|nr:secretin receptor-like [Pollicipes pollicipes]